MTAIDTLRATIDRLLVELPADQLHEFVATLEGGKARALARIVAEAAIPEVDAVLRLVDAAEMAAILGVPTFWVQDKGRRGIIPRVTMGHYQRFNVPEVLEAVRHLPKSHDAQFRSTKTRTQKRSDR